MNSAKKRKKGKKKMPRNYNVTSTINTTVVNYLSFNAEKGAIEQRETNVKASAELSADDMLKVIRKTDNLAVQVIGVKVISELYGMESDTFYAISNPITSDERRNLITRTMKACLVSIAYYDFNTGGIEHDTIVADSGFDKLDSDKQLTIIRKQYETDSKKVVQVGKIDFNEQLRGVTVEKFIKNAVILNPETRRPFEEKEEQE